MATTQVTNQPSGGGGGAAEGSLSDWVSHVQQQHSGAARSPLVTPASPNFAAATGGSSADALEQEVLRAREQRMKRRSQLSGAASTAAGSTTVNNSARANTIPAAAAAAAADTALSSSATTATTPQLSGEETLRKLLGERGIKSPTLNSSSSPVHPSSSPSPTMRSNALLDRYGGASGPTGVARAGTHDSPVSLASFMGGKASGPRLGKLAGDGRSAPPEASMIHESRQALPGLASKSNSSGVASESAGVGSQSTPLASFLEARAVGKSAALSSSPPKYSYMPPKLSSSSSPTTTKHSPSTFRPPSPHRALSPIRAPNTSATTSINVPETQFERQAAFSAGRKEASTSPFKADETPTFSQELSPQAKTLSTSRALSPGQIVHSPTADALARFPEIAHSPATSPLISSDNQTFPGSTAERGYSSSSPARSPALPDLASSSNDSRYTTHSTTLSAPSRSPLPSPAATGLSNALPGLSGQRGGAPTRNLYAVNRKTPEEEAAAFAPPVRLPGMGAATSPFAVASAAHTQSEADQRAATQTLEPLVKGRARPKKTVTSSHNLASQAMTADAATPGGEERMNRETFNSARQAFGGSAVPSFVPQRSSSPVKLTPSLNVETERTTTTTGYANRKDSNQSGSGGPDSAARIADNTAALEALIEGRKVVTPPLRQNDVPAEKLARRRGTLKIAKNRDHAVNVDFGALGANAQAHLLSSNRKTIALDVQLVKPDGSMAALQGQDVPVLFETDTQVIVHRFKDTATSAVVSTNVYARVGRLSSMVTGANSVEARTVMEIAQRHRVPVIDARQGRESSELAHILGGVLITREGHRNEANNTPMRCMFQVRGQQGSIFVDQVDMLTGSLCSALSVVLQTASSRGTLVWHGKGATESIRSSAVQCARRFASSATVTEIEEGQEQATFWSYLDQSAPYSNAWHNRFLPRLRSDQLIPRLFGIQAQKASSWKVVEITPFSTLDVRRDGVFLLQLPLELYVLVGPDARSQRQSISAMIDAASTLSRKQSQQRGPHVMPMPVHVVVFPTLVPRDLRSAFRYWQDDHLNGKRWQRIQLRMNVWERREAQEQLDRNEYNLDELDDDLFLPVGVGLDDVKGIDI